MTRLWLPFGVTDLDEVKDFYVDRIGLSVVDSWNDNGERGLVLATEARLEFVANGDPTPESESPLAFQLRTATDVDNSYARWRPANPLAPPHRYPRGHYGFEFRGPAGARVMIWSER